MGDWLLKKDDYVPKADKDSFIDKTIVGTFKYFIINKEK
ncbi:cobalt transport protein [Clostridium carboxidivorans P7]|uniref:Cobalt transport protein n=1 Tax=Clostridium carboxidivorans P7 TaxID=536227 RepID=C6PWU4_9CLOT|nr:cobalt transport protein [Clostridium carboxidivorans P7]